MAEPSDLRDISGGERTSPGSGAEVLRNAISHVEQLLRRLEYGAPAPLDTAGIRGSDAADATTAGAETGSGDVTGSGDGSVNAAVPPEDRDPFGSRVTADTGQSPTVGAAADRVASFSTSLGAHDGANRILAEAAHARAEAAADGQRMLTDAQHLAAELEREAAAEARRLRAEAAESARRLRADAERTLRTAIEDATSAAETLQEAARQDAERIRAEASEAAEAEREEGERVTANALREAEAEAQRIRERAMEDARREAEEERSRRIADAVEAARAEAEAARAEAMMLHAAVIGQTHRVREAMNSMLGGVGQLQIDLTESLAQLAELGVGDSTGDNAAADEETPAADESTGEPGRLVVVADPDDADDEFAAAEDERRRPLGALFRKERS